MSAIRHFRKLKVSECETIGNFAPKHGMVAQIHAYSSPSKTSGKAARARATWIFSSAS